MKAPSGKQWADLHCLGLPPSLSQCWRVIQGYLTTDPADCPHRAAIVQQCRPDDDLDWLERGPDHGGDDGVLARRASYRLDLGWSWDAGCSHDLFRRTYVPTALEPASGSARYTQNEWIP